MNKVPPDVAVLQVPQFTELHGMRGCLVAPTKIIAGGNRRTLVVTSPSPTRS